MSWKYTYSTSRMKWRSNDVVYNSEALGQAALGQTK
ncbi:hypothetical protein CCACVL1_11635 [Corchorus capsularis]|uniref:Uncharacterized protein n=1 Tax=Corchorus capsularis TaxID=210143 RepID=A0A1R3IK45_COCAP|nr:hypothetical protein CCACVL1_11635 [Corchorus capsularis]